MIKVLLVDDDKDLLEMVCMMLKTPAIAPVCIDSGSKVIPYVESLIPDVVVLDIYLGNYDGRNLCKQIKNSEQYADVPVLLYSAGDIKPESIRDCGADDFLRKPFEMEQLIEKIELLAKQT